MFDYMSDLRESRHGVFANEREFVVPDSVAGISVAFFPVRVV